MMALPLAIVLLLSACSDWPDIEGPGGDVTSMAWPSLQPSGGVAQSAAMSGQDAAAFSSLQARSDRLRLRAALLRSPVPDQASFDRLRARLAS